MQKKDYRDSYVSAHLSNTVASQIFMLREANGWTQTQLAEKAGMRQSRISALEDPNNENLEIKTLKRLASAYDVGLTIRFVRFSEIVNWADKMTPAELAPTNFNSDSLASNFQDIGIWWPSVDVIIGNVVAVAKPAPQGQSAVNAVRIFDAGDSVDIAISALTTRGANVVLTDGRVN